MGRQRHQNLDRDRGEPDRAHGGEKGRGRRRDGSQPERERARRDAKHDQPAVLEPVAERHDEEKPQAVADLRQGHDQAGRARRKADRRGDRADQRLRVINVGDDQPAGGGKQQNGRGGNVGRGRRRTAQPIQSQAPLSNTSARPWTIGASAAFEPGTPAIRVISARATPPCETTKASAVSVASHGLRRVASIA